MYLSSGGCKPKDFPLVLGAIIDRSFFTLQVQNDRWGNFYHTLSVFTTMLQRIQTVYLLIITALMVSVLFLPLASIQVADTFYTFDATGISAVSTQTELVYPIWALFALTSVIALIALITIFLYKKRVLQIRLSIFNGILMVGFYALFAFFVYNLKGIMKAEDVDITFKIALSFPLISLILDYLTIRNIGADEMLVRSLNRLR